MKLLCPRCKAGKEIGSASRFCVFVCDSCGNHFRGIHAEVAKWNRLWKSLFTFDNSVYWYNRTGCPNCGGLVPLVENPSGPGFTAPATCMYCGHDLPTTPAYCLSAQEMAELERDFASVNLTEAQVRQLRGLLASYTLPDHQRQRLEQLIAGNRASAATPPATPAPPPAKPAPKPQGYTKEELEAIEIVLAVQRGEIPAPLPPEEKPKPSYPPGYKPNPRIEAMHEEWKRRNQK